MKRMEPSSSGEETAWLWAEKPHLATEDIVLFGWPTSCPDESHSSALSRPRRSTPSRLVKPCGYPGWASERAIKVCQKPWGRPGGLPISIRVSYRKLYT